LQHICLLPNEGNQEGRALYKQNQLMLALQVVEGKDCRQALEHIAAARAWPENLGAGKPFDADIDERLEDYLEAACSEQLGQTAEAARLWTKIVHYPPEATTAIPANTLVLALALRELGKPSAAESVLQSWLQREPGSRLARWCLDAYHGDVRAEPRREPPENDYEDCAVLRSYLLEKTSQGKAGLPR
jgi:tetratricopeptide (TPR) repeat protein